MLPNECYLPTKPHRCRAEAGRPEKPNTKKQQETNEMSAATQNGMDKLIRERDRAREDRDAMASRVDFLNQQNSAQQEQNDALSAPAVREEPVAWVTEDTIDGQTVNGKPRRVWWENIEGVGIPIYAAPQPARSAMTTNKPEVVAYLHTDKENPEHRGVSLHHDSSCTSTMSVAEPLICLSDYDALSAQVENWEDAAAQFARNADFYRGIVHQIGELFGEEARTSDDGSVQGDVLALKVPELVEALAAHLERLTRYSKEARLCLDHARVFISTRQKMHECGREAHDECLACLTQSLEDTPATSLARRDARIKAEALDAVLHVGAEEIKAVRDHYRRQAEESAK